MGRKNNLITQLGCMCLAFGGVVAPAAAEDISVSAGLRLWSSKWQGNVLRQVGGATVSTHNDSGSTTVPMPILSVRYGDFGVSVSQFMSTDYSLSDGLTSSTEARSEYDVNAFYSFIPGLSVGLGYKKIKFPSAATKGPTVSLSGSVPIGAGLGLYATGGIGWLDTKLGSANKLNTDYALGEFGLTYSFNVEPKFLKSLTATVGYRSQKITVKSVPFAGGRDVSDTTSGITFGLIGTF